MKRKRKFYSTLFLAPSFLGLMLIWGGPLLVVVYYSIINNPIQKKLVGLGNYIKIIHNDAFISAAKNTILFSSIFVPLLVVLSLGLALLLNEKIACRSQFRTAFLCPLMVPVASIVLVWQTLFHNKGTINTILNSLGIASIDWLKSSFSLLVVGSLFIWKNIGYNMILFMAALGNIPQEQIDAISLETSSSIKQFWYLKLKYLYPTVFFVSILSLVNSFKIYRETYLLSGSYPYGSLYMLQNFMNNTFSSMDYAKLSSGAIIMLIFIVAIVGFLFWGENKLGKDLEG